MKAESEGPVVEDQLPPDERAARAARDKATRLAESAVGLSLFAAALVVATAFVLLYTLGDRSSPYYVPAWLGVLFGLGVVHWPLFFWIQKRRARAGLPLVEAKRPSVVRIALLTAALAVWVLAACLVILHLRDFEAYRFAIVVPFGIGYGVLCGIRGVGCRQWEDVIQGAVLCVVSVIVALSPRFPAEVWLILFALWFVLSGLVKHLRWRRWVGSLADRAAEASPEGVQP